MKFLIIGGTRFVGRHLAAELLARGQQVTVLNRGVTPDDLPPEIERLRADRTDSAALASAVAGRCWDGVVDFAAYRGPESEEAARIFGGRTGHFIHISTGQVYLVRDPMPEGTCREEDADGALRDAPPLGSDHAGWVYGVEKRECETALLAARLGRGFPMTILRLPMVQGARDHFQRVHQYVARLQDGGPILVPEAPDRPLRHIYGPDVARIIADLLIKERGVGEVYNLSQDDALPFDRFLALVGEAMGVEPRVVRVPREVLEREGLLPECSPFSGRWMSLIDNGKARRELGVTFTAPEEYVPEMVREIGTLNPATVDGYQQRSREIELAEAH